MTTHESAATLLSTAVVPRRADALRRTIAQFTFLDYAAVAVVLLLVAAVVAPGLLTPYDPLVGDDAITLKPPSLAHPLGTDNLGRDVWARIVYGTSTTLLASALAVAVGLGVGTVLGLVAAVAGGPVDAVISRIVDALLSIPGLLLAMVVVVSLGFGTLNAAIAVGVSTVATFARLMRSEVLTIKELPFVEASRHIGGRPFYVLRRHVFPNSFTAVLSLAALQFGIAILWISALSFLGYGAPPPQPEWGLLVSEGRNYVVSSSWLVLFPGLTILATVWAINRLSYSVRGNRNDV